MVNRVDGVRRYPYPDTNSIKTGASATSGQSSSSSSFSSFNLEALDAQLKGGVIYEPSGADKVKQTESRPINNASDLGSRTARAATASGAVVEESFVAGIRRVLHEVVATIKDFAKKIWEGNEGASTTREEEREPEPAVATATAFNANSIIKNQEAEDRLVQMLANDNRGHLVKNSDLLTYYDRSGKITKVDPSDRTKIISGIYDDIYL